MEGKGAEFEKIFARTHNSLVKVKGCSELKLIKDEEDPNTYVTTSVWDSIDDLDAYRNSDLFKVLWEEIKPLFNGSPEAHTMIQ
jgi:heme-degrading monooxygenase HmoA